MSSYPKEDYIYSSLSEISGFCEWDPKRNQLSSYQETYDFSVKRIVKYWGCQSKATVIVGHNGKYRLCESCSKLPYFKKYRKRKQII
jgi:hypothetical protein